MVYFDCMWRQRILFTAVHRNNNNNGEDDDDIQSYWENANRNHVPSVCCLHSIDKHVVQCCAHEILFGHQRQWQRDELSLFVAIATAHTHTFVVQFDYSITVFQNVFIESVWHSHIVCSSNNAQQEAFEFWFFVSSSFSLLLQSNSIS